MSSNTTLSDLNLVEKVVLGIAVSFPQAQSYDVSLFSARMWIAVWTIMYVVVLNALISTMLFGQVRWIVDFTNIYVCIALSVALYFPLVGLTKGCDEYEQLEALKGVQLRKWKIYGWTYTMIPAIVGGVYIFTS